MIPVEAVAQVAGTIPYEILTGLNQRIPRLYRGG
jgi:alanine racemase